MERARATQTAPARARRLPASPRARPAAHSPAALNASRVMCSLSFWSGRIRGNKKLIKKTSPPVFLPSPFVAAFAGFAVAQSLKVLTFYAAEGRWEPSRLVGSGGMPSSHTAAVAALAAAVAAIAGTSSPEFAICAVLAGVVMYDASGVRLAAGRHASVLNSILTELPPEHPAACEHSTPLRDSLGHTPLQVAAGALLGCVTGYIVGSCFR